MHQEVATEGRADHYYNVCAFVISTLEKSLCLITENNVVVGGGGINEAGMQD